MNYMFLHSLYLFLLFQNSNGIVLNIPMPGHTVSDSLIDQIRKDVETLEQLIEEHDAIFLLMDSRESRWLPSMLGSAKNKVCVAGVVQFILYTGIFFFCIFLCEDISNF